MEQHQEEGSDIKIESSVNLPEDVSIEILSWLPVKSLLRFRSVSKTWKFLIDQPLFVSIHQSKMKSHLVVSYYEHGYQLTNCYLYPDETLSRADGYDYQELDLDIVSSDSGLILGPCNGIFAVFNNNRIALWNPATKLFGHLPVAYQPTIPLDFFRVSEISLNRMGFGMDPNACVYKVFWYREFGYKSPTPQLLVYTSDANLWRELDHTHFISFRFNHHFDRETFSFNGVLYWIVCGVVDIGNQIVGPTSLLPFDLSDEQFQDVIPMPNPSRGLKFPSLAVCGGCIAVIDCCYAQDASDLDESDSDSDKLISVGVWVMVEKGNWVYKCEIGPFEGIITPLGMWKDYVIIETDIQELVLCDSFGVIWKTLPPFGSAFLHCVQAFVYSESLVSVKVGDHSSGSDEEEGFAADFFCRACTSTDEDSS